ncbi:MAG: hypothetical protein ACTSYQ_04740, partial [Candidatus Odinarchaeia archaeon]
MLAEIVIGLFIFIAGVLTYLVIKKPTVTADSYNRNDENKKILDLDFYIKKSIEGKNNLFLRVKNLSDFEVKDIRGFFSYHSRLGNQLG